MIEAHTPILMVDTETTGELDCPFTYDVGYQIFTLADGVLCERSFVNADIFLDKEMMANAYYAEKVPQYWEDIKQGRRVLKRWANIKRQIAQDCKTYGVEIACAHNAMFDNRSLNTTQRWLTKSKYRYFLPYGIEWWDTLKMARNTLKNNDDYGEFCYNHDYLTKRGCRRYTAEILYKWLTGRDDFEEKHTGLEDVKIEREIFLYCLRENPQIDGRLWADKKV